MVCRRTNDESIYYRKIGILLPHYYHNAAGLIIRLHRTHAFVINTSCFIIIYFNSFPMCIIASAAVTFLRYLRNFVIESKNTKGT